MSTQRHSSLLYSPLSFEVFTIVSAGAVAAGVVIFLNVKFGVRPSEAVYAAIPFTIPILLAGFYKYQGYMPFKKLLEEISYSRKCRELHFESKDNEMIEKRRFRIGEEKKERRKKCLS